MTVYRHINPLTNATSAVTIIDVALHVYADGSFDIDTGSMVFRMRPTIKARDVAAYHKFLFASEAED